MNIRRRGYWEGLPFRMTALIGRTIKNIFLSKGMIAALIFILIPAYISVYTLLDPQEGMKEWWNLFSWFGLALFLQILVLIYSLLYGGSMINEEIENRTMTYLTIRGARKAEIYISKYIGTVLSLIAMFTFSILVTYLILGSHGPIEDITGKIEVLFSLMAATYFGILVYTALFSLAGTKFKRPLMVGLLYAFFWEIIMVNIEFNIGRLTLMQYLRSIFAANDDVATALDLPNTVDPTFSWIFLLVLIPLFIVIGCVVLHNKDIN
jgi:ABC-type transport system involved in multi-copper enzyme maturation permease subunit